MDHTWVYVQHLHKAVVSTAKTSWQIAVPGEADSYQNRKARSIAQCALITPFSPKERGRTAVHLLKFSRGQTFDGFALLIASFMALLSVAGL